MHVAGRTFQSKCVNGFDRVQRGAGERVDMTYGAKKFEKIIWIWGSVERLAVGPDIVEGSALRTS